MKKLALLVLSVLMVLGLTACGSGSGTSGTTTSTTETGGTGAKVVRFNVGFEPDDFDPQASNVMEQSIILTQMYDGLFRENENGEFVPSLAKDQPVVSEDGLEYTFTLKDGLKFADGTPLTAKDVKYSWVRGLDPANAFEYAYQLYYIKGAEAFNAGEGTADDLGIEVVDDTTLKVTLESPTPYFVSLTGFLTLMVVSEDFANAQATYGADVASSLSSGPFTPVEWNKGQYVKFVKNENYWDADSVNLDELYIYSVAESSTEIQMYETGQLDITYLQASTADKTRLTAEGVLNSYSTLNTRYLMINNTREGLNDPRVRKALALALDRELLANNVVTNCEVAGGFIPNDMAAVDNVANKFRTEDLLPKNGNVEDAKGLLADAGYPDGAGLPQIEIVYTTSDANKALAEAIVEMWKTNLGIDAVATNLEGTVRRDRKNTGDFDISLDGWSTDYIDPFSFMEILTTDNQYNQGMYSNAEYDTLIDTAKNTSDQAVRQESMAAAEKILIDEMGLIPLYNATNSYLQKDNITHVVRSLLGSVDFKWCDVE